MYLITVVSELNFTTVIMLGPLSFLLFNLLFLSNRPCTEAWLCASKISDSVKKVQRYNYICTPGMNWVMGEHAQQSIVQ